MFPTVDSHYCRKSTGKKGFLSERLNVVKMHNMYVSWCIGNKYKPESYKYYLDVFNHDFKLAFHKRKKDKCLKCNKYENSDLTPIEKTLIFREEDAMRAMPLNELTQYCLHSVKLFQDGNGNPIKLPSIDDANDYVLQKIKACQEEEVGTSRTQQTIPSDTDTSFDRASEEGDIEEEDEEVTTTSWRQHLYDKILSRAIKNKFASTDEQGTVYACFDLQQVLETPYSDVGDLFYKRCLSTYNFVVNEKTDKQAHCYLWSELDGNRGANDMSTCIILYVKERAAQGIQRFLFACDNCPGQTRNRQLAAAATYCVNHIEGVLSIEVLFLVRGHTENCADEVHSAIEGEKNIVVYTPSDWAVLVRNTKMKDAEIIMHHLDYSDFFHVTDYMNQIPNFYKDEAGDTIVNWNYTKHWKVSADSPYTFMFKVEYDADFSEIDMLQLGGCKRKKRKSAKDIPSEMKAAYKKPHPISVEKYNDLMWMCQNGIIPKRQHYFFEEITTK